MDKMDSKDKLKLQDMLEEVESLKTYNRELLDNTKGEKLENYIGALDRSVDKLKEKLDEYVDKQ